MTKAICEDCPEPATLNYHGSEVCGDCFSRRENRDQDREPDGEAFRGGEATSCAGEQMAAARRLR